MGELSRIRLIGWIFRALIGLPCGDTCATPARAVDAVGMVFKDNY
jgi:hypothetical protein